MYIYKENTHVLCRLIIRFLITKYIEKKVRSNKRKSKVKLPVLAVFPLREGKASIKKTINCGTVRKVLSGLGG